MKRKVNLRIKLYVTKECRLGKPVEYDRTN